MTPGGDYKLELSEVQTLVTQVNSVVCGTGMNDAYNTMAADIESASCHSVVCVTDMNDAYNTMAADIETTSCHSVV